MGIELVKDTECDGLCCEGCGQQWADQPGWSPCDACGKVCPKCAPHHVHPGAYGSKDEPWADGFQCNTCGRLGGSEDWFPCGSCGEVYCPDCPGVDVAGDLICRDCAKDLCAECGLDDGGDRVGWVMCTCQNRGDGKVCLRSLCPDCADAHVWIRHSAPESIPWELWTWSDEWGDELFALVGRRVYRFSRKHPAGVMPRFDEWCSSTAEEFCDRYHGARGVAALQGLEVAKTYNNPVRLARAFLDACEGGKE